MAETIPTRPARHAATNGAGPAKLPAAPRHLSKQSKERWRAIVSGWVLDVDGLGLLQAACEMWDQYRRAQALVVKEGSTVINPKSGVARVHPAAKVAHDSLAQYRQCLRQLGLEPPGVGERGVVA